MTLAGVRVRHPWVDGSNNKTMRVTGYGPIQSEQTWKDSGLLLGEAVHAVVKHLQMNPPQILEITDKGLQSIQSRNGSVGNTRDGTKVKSPPPSGNGMNMNGSRGRSLAGSNHSSNNDAPPPGYHDHFVAEPSRPAPEVPMPPIPSSYPEVKDLPRAALDELMEDELEFLALVHKLKIFDQIFTVGWGAYGVLFLLKLFEIFGLRL